MRLKLKKFFIFSLSVFLFVVILSVLNRFANGTKRTLHTLHKMPAAYNNYEIKKIKKQSISSAMSKQGAYRHYSKKSLKDIFNLPGKKYSKFSRLFMLSAKKAKDGVRNSMPALPAGLSDSNFLGGGDLDNIVKNIKFKGFPRKKNQVVSLIFTSGKIALVRINGNRHYVHTGENIDGVFILKIGSSKISYSYKGKIKNKYIDD